MADNMMKWNALRTVPTEHLKAIKGGRLNGKSDINPQWRLQVMTEQFGACGTGWRYTIDRLWTEQGDNGEVCAFALVSVYAGGEAIPGVGGSMLVAREQGGLHTSDEAYKMAVTDALSVALKALGVAADIYLGKWDGSKYKTDAAPAPQTAAPAEPERKYEPVNNPAPTAPVPAAPAPHPNADPEGDHFCKEHNCKFYRNEKNGEVWYSHKIKDGANAGKYCNEVKK